MSVRKVIEIIRGHYTIDGAGVKLYRVFGGPKTAILTDPFLLLDHFGSKNPLDYIAGFPWHPHRGIETITYMLKGRVKHEDSTGLSGIIEGGDIQWMTAGSGIFHQEMPQLDADGEMWGFQLWVNLPAEKKMIMPKYKNLKYKAVPEVTLDNGVKVKVISGKIGDIEGPIKDLAVDVEYYDVTIPPQTTFIHTVKRDYNVMTYVIEGEGSFDDKGTLIRERELAIFSVDGEFVVIKSTSKKPLRLLFLSGKPLNEPIAWYGPIVMNYDYEIQEALRELREGTFVKKQAKVIDIE
jgi:redox-sensitive bicupin YhaK (pirin superfamily)